MNEAPQTLFKIILDGVQEQMRDFPFEAPRFQKLSTLQHALAVSTTMTIAPLCAGTCEACHATARGVVVLMAVAIKQIDDEMMAILSDPEYAPIVHDMLAHLREQMVNIGTAPGGLTEQDLMELGVHPSQLEEHQTGSEPPKE